MAELAVAIESFPLRRAFGIARGSKSEISVVTVTLRDGAAVGRGECVPYARYGETPDSVAEAIRTCANPLAFGLDPEGLCRQLPAGAARNALDCALLDLAAKRAGRPVWQMLGLASPEPVVTAMTIGLDTPAAMAAAARAEAHLPLLKVKLGAADTADMDRLAAVRDAAPDARLIVDPNEGWDLRRLVAYLPALHAAGVELVEQPTPARDDDALLGLNPPVRLAADESTHGKAGIDHLLGRYQVVNIKLDKTGGLTEALRIAQAARAAGLGLMLGSMMSTSLSAAPALLLAGQCDWIDLDGPLWVAQDRSPPLRTDGAVLYPPDPALWG